MQAGIKGKVMQAEMEITKSKEQIKGETKDTYRQTEAEQKLLQRSMANEANTKKKELSLAVDAAKKELQNDSKK